LANADLREDMVLEVLSSIVLVSGRGREEGEGWACSPLEKCEKQATINKINFH
jgi:hypothetical protein